jgi:Icc-related predicted phosphoesterase
MIDLDDYLGKRVEVTFIDDIKIIGVMDTFDSAPNTESGYDEATVKIDKGWIIEVIASEVKDIKVSHKPIPKGSRANEPMEVSKPNPPGYIASL